MLGLLLYFPLARNRETLSTATDRYVSSALICSSTCRYGFPLRLVSASALSMLVSKGGEHISSRMTPSENRSALKS
jgi:hypothetical protein